MTTVREFLPTSARGSSVDSCEPNYLAPVPTEPASASRSWPLLLPLTAERLTLSANPARRPSRCGSGSSRGRRGQTSTEAQRQKNELMGKQAGLVLYVITMVVVIVTLDILFLRHHVWLRLIVNVGIVLVFGAVYLVVLRRR